MSILNKLKKAGFWQTTQTVIQVVFQFAYIGVMARLLSKSDFGLMAIAGGFIGMGTIFSEGGMSAALIQRKNITQKHMNAGLQGGILIGGLLFVIFFFSSKYIANFFNQPSLNLLIKVIGINVVLHSISGISMGLLQKYFQFHKIALVNLTSTIVGYIAGIILGLKGFGVWSLVVATLSTSLINTVGFLYLAPVRLSLRVHIKEWKELFSFGFGMILLKIANYFNDRGLNLILGKILDADLLGVFERVSKIKIIPSIYIGKILDTIMFPAMSEIQDEHERLFKIYQHALGVVNSLLMPVAVYLIIFSEEVVLLLLGSNWHEAVLPLQIMFVVIPFSSSGRMADSVIRAKGLIYKNVARKFIYVAVLISTTSLGAYFFGVIGAAIAVTFSFVFNYIIMLFLVKNIFKKSIKEIFFLPVKTGFNLSVMLVPFTALNSIILKNFIHQPIVVFILITSILSTIMLLIVWKKPTLLGTYLHYTILQLLKKETI
ncbi:membrane hypothetical protein [Desulfamplus magnetovallimortis]|uniref:Polysaccharide biosynthesis protein n=1 Tax=Desulfamplus magnetovallimortis TaxID=1246637 RepID=A0A1W1H885_9BACT|nr:lipopolysaccharide biosynthesis protein [Desulfamplus magnetovallimortis]SLM28700.1 membrane hypothetical protein [Desulfamplus magnetovallimortis]